MKCAIGAEIKLTRPNTANTLFIFYSFLVKLYKCSMNFEHLDDEQKMELQKQFEENRKLVLAMDPEEFLERLVKMHDSTDVILEGYDLVTNINEGHGIAVAGLIRLRNALMDSIEWITHNLLEDDEEEEL